MSHQLLPSLEELEAHAEQYPEFARWRAGYGPLRHSAETQAGVFRLAHRLVQAGQQPDLPSVYCLLEALDRLTCAGQWLVLHMGYARRVHLDGAPLTPEDFKAQPFTAIRDALPWVPAYAGYLALNALSGETRAWRLGEGRAGAAIEAFNVLTGNLHPEQAARYPVDEAGLSRLVADFAASTPAADGLAGVPLGPYPSAYTAGALSEGSEPISIVLQCVHQPLPGETLVACLSAEAIQRTANSAAMPYWWRVEDCGVVLPLVLAGVGVPQSDALPPDGGDFLRSRGFDPVPFDGCDPAAVVCALHEMEQHLAHRLDEQRRGLLTDPLPLPCGLAEDVAGEEGLWGAIDDEAALREAVQRQIAALWVEPEALHAALATVAQSRPGRVRESEQALVQRQPPLPQQPALAFSALAAPPLEAVEAFFLALAAANPALRPRVAQPLPTAPIAPPLEALRAALHERVCAPRTARESRLGAVLGTFSPEEALAVCLANQGGLNLLVCEEAQGSALLDALRQTLRFARQQREIRRPAGWLGWPLVLTAQTWDGVQPARAQQDTSFGEALLGEMSDGIRLLSPADYNSTLALLAPIYQARGRLACLLLPQTERPCVFDAQQAEQLARDGALCVAEHQAPGEPLLLIAHGSHQLSEMQRAAQRLSEVGLAWLLVYLQEPGRFRAPRDELEQAVCAEDALREALFPVHITRRVLLTHLRAEVLRGQLWPLLPDAARSVVLGYRNRGGAFDTAGMLFANQCTWASVLSACARLLDIPRTALLSAEEAAALVGRGDPAVLR